MNINTRTISRTWAAPTTTRFYDGVCVVDHTVTITRTASGVRATVNGLPMTIFQAQGVLNRADFLTVTGEVLDTTIGKPAACELHRELGRLGFRAHYTTASEALARPVSSFAALSEADAYTVRDYARGQWGMTA